MTPPRISYQKVKQFLLDMRNANQLDDLAHAWEQFLIFHQRTWNKSMAYYVGKTFWGSLQNKYSLRRKKEDILIYVHQARHADEHGIQAIAQNQLGSTVIFPGVLTSSHIVGGGAYMLGSGSTATIKVTPSDVLANPVTNREKTFNPPVLDGNANPSVLRIAEEAIKFFEDLFIEIDNAGGD